MQTLSDLGSSAEEDRVSIARSSPRWSPHNHRQCRAREVVVPLLVLVAIFIGSIAIQTLDVAAAPAETYRPAPQTIFQSGDADQLMLDEAVDELPVVDDARWSSRWTARTPVAVAVWVVLLIGLSFAGRPLARTLLGSFPDGGQGFARLILLLFAAWGVWFAASYDVITFRAVWAWYAIVVAAVIGWLLASSKGSEPRATTELAGCGRSRSGILDRFRLLPDIAILQSRLLASLLGRRETDGVRAYQRAPTHAIVPSFRSMVFGRHHAAEPTPPRRPHRQLPDERPRGAARRDARSQGSLPRPLWHGPPRS